jgi:hypothetical protein
MLDLDVCYKRHKNIITKSLGGKRWALDMETGNEYTLNEAAYDLLNILATPQNAGSLIEAMMGIYEVSRDTAVHDCEKWILYALDKGIIEQPE